MHNRHGTPSGGHPPHPRHLKGLWLRYEVLADIVGAIWGVGAVIKVDRNRIDAKISRGNGGSTGNTGDICGIVYSGSADASKGAGATEDSDLAVLRVDGDRETVNFDGPRLEMTYEFKYCTAASVADRNVIERNDRPKRSVPKLGDASIYDEPIVDASAGARDDS